MKSCVAGENYVYTTEYKSPIKFKLTQKYFCIEKKRFINVSH